MSVFHRQSETPELLRRILSRNLVTVSDNVLTIDAAAVSEASTLDIKNGCISTPDIIELADSTAGVDTKQKHHNACKTTTSRIPSNNLGLTDVSREITIPFDVSLKNSRLENSSFMDENSKNSRSDYTNDSRSDVSVRHSHNSRCLSQFTDESFDSGFGDSRRGSGASASRCGDTSFPSCFWSPLNSSEMNRLKSFCSCDPNDGDIPMARSTDLQDLPETVAEFDKLNISPLKSSRTNASPDSSHGLHFSQEVSPLVSQDKVHKCESPPSVSKDPPRHYAVSTHHSFQDLGVHQSPANTWLLSPLPTPPRRRPNIDCTGQHKRSSARRESRDSFADMEKIPEMATPRSSPVSRGSRMSIANNLFQFRQPRRVRKASMNTQHLIKRTDIKLGDFIDTGSFGTVHEGS